ncbi:hypothetical protein [uncultured Agitococcus sp.]|jgi:hypothetical protein|uniref:hypothetical protein n=1 Tax=uncultured Agitococcus sp. TaxID=1506599 RepID=UPI002633E3EC|nr:hypothetical protein [uncultured Agitococcus sp.]
MSDFIDKLLSVLESVFIAVLILVFVINPFIPPKIPILNNEKLREEIYKTKTCERFILLDPEKFGHELIHRSIRITSYEAKDTFMANILSYILNRKDTWVFKGDFYSYELPIDTKGQTTPKKTRQAKNEFYGEVSIVGTERIVTVLKVLQPNDSEKKFRPLFFACYR